MKDGASDCGNPDKSGHKMDAVIMTLLIRPSFQPSPPTHFLPSYPTVALFYEVYCETLNLLSNVISTVVESVGVVELMTDKQRKKG